MPCILLIPDQINLLVDPSHHGGSGVAVKHEEGKKSLGIYRAEWSIIFEGLDALAPHERSGEGHCGPSVGRAIFLSPDPYPDYGLYT